MGYRVMDDNTPFKVTCDSCDLENVLRTEAGVAYLADLHEIAMPLHSTTLWIVDKYAKED